MTIRKCQQCDLPLTSRKQRKFCSVQCATLSQRKRKTKVCEECETSYSIPLSADKRHRSKYCSASCRRAALQRHLTRRINKTCEHCKSLFLTKPACTRRFCSVPCYRAYQKTPEWSKELSPSGLGDVVRLRALTLPCHKCESFPSHIHHKDGDRTNNSLDNLVPLCRPCHHLLHSYFQEAQKGLLAFTNHFLK